MCSSRASSSMSTFGLVMVARFVPVALLWAIFWAPVALATRPVPLGSTASLAEGGSIAKEAHVPAIVAGVELDGMQALWTAAKRGQLKLVVHDRSQLLKDSARELQATKRSVTSTGQKYPSANAADGSSESSMTMSSHSRIQHSTGPSANHGLERRNGNFHEAIFHSKLQVSPPSSSDLRFAEMKRKGPSPGHGHKAAVAVSAPVLGESKRKGPSPGAGHAFTTGRGSGFMGGIKRSGPSPGHGH